MDILEFILWWLGQGENATALVLYIVFGGFITAIAFMNSVLFGMFLLLVLGVPVLILGGYAAQKEIKKTYAGWQQLRDKQKK